MQKTLSQDASFAMACMRLNDAKVEGMLKLILCKFHASSEECHEVGLELQDSGQKRGSTNDHD